MPLHFWPRLLQPSLRRIASTSCPRWVSSTSMEPSLAILISLIPLRKFIICSSRPKTMQRTPQSSSGSMAVPVALQCSASCKRTVHSGSSLAAPSSIQASIRGTARRTSSISNSPLVSVSPIARAPRTAPSMITLVARTT